MVEVVSHLKYLGVTIDTNVCACMHTYLCVYACMYTCVCVFQRGVAVATCAHLPGGVSRDG